MWKGNRPMRIALLGCGTVGGGVYEFVQARTDMEIAYVLSRRPRPDLTCRSPPALNKSFRIPRWTP